MTNALLIQLPIPQINFGKRTANVPLAAACLKLSAEGLRTTTVDILPESVSSYLCDAALARLILSASPDVVGFSVYNWNLHRSIHMAKILKQTSPAKIIFGGPEITHDNHFDPADCVDFMVMGEGETAFRKILKDISGRRTKIGQETLSKKRFGSFLADKKFSTRQSPYLNNLLEPHVDNLMYLESQRGCIYRCGFCYYNKSRKTIAAADDGVVLDAVQWGMDNDVIEVCIIDPSFNARPGLKGLLGKITGMNKHRMISLNGEIRAEMVDNETADLFASAGFTSFEIGLQSTNPKALEIMNRNTDLKRFLRGTTLLKERGIVPKIDLIVGLPGDDLKGFKKSLMFIAENDLADDVQIFPLSVLPGTMFRQNDRGLGLKYEPYPPYSIKQTSTFPMEDIYLSFDYAESLFDVSLFPAPFLDIAYKNKTKLPMDSSDILVQLHNNRYIKTLVLDSIRPVKEIMTASGQMTFPYQILIGPSVKDIQFICAILKILTEANQFTPLEIIFLNPDSIPDTQLLLSAVKLSRPNYLDIYNTYQYNAPGNRSALFTLVSDRQDVLFAGEMKRQVFWWKKKVLPDAHDLNDLSAFDGILIDTDHRLNDIKAWQDHMAPLAEEMLYVSFADIAFQKRWLGLTAADEFSGLFL